MDRMKANKGFHLFLSILLILFLLSKNLLSFFF